MKEEEEGLTAENINENYKNFKEFWSNAGTNDNEPVADEIITKMKEELKPMLVESVCWVCFRKANGDHRVMRGTLKSELLPPKLELVDDKPKVKKASNPDVQNLFDLDINRWRSFRWDSLVTYESEPLSK